MQKRADTALGSRQPFPSPRSYSHTCDASESVNKNVKSPLARAFCCDCKYVEDSFSAKCAVIQTNYFCFISFILGFTTSSIYCSSSQCGKLSSINSSSKSFIIFKTCSSLSSQYEKRITGLLP